MNEAPIRVVPRATAADGQGAGRRLKLKVLRKLGVENRVQAVLAARTRHKPTD